MSFVERCEEKLRLLIEYQNRTAEYSLAVSELAFRCTSNEEFEGMSRAAEKARIASQNARERLMRHVEEHRC
jgi:hypothetical protein